MKVALFSDIHGNITGLKAALAFLDKIGGADMLFAAGDTLGGGPGAEDVLDLLLERNVRMVLGNHEELDLESVRPSRCRCDCLWPFSSPSYSLAGIEITRECRKYRIKR